MEMKKKPLIETNPHLQNPKKYRQALIKNVASSTAIETGTSVESITKILTDKKRNELIKKPQHSDR
jgi:ribosomal protein L32E